MKYDFMSLAIVTIPDDNIKEKEVFDLVPLLQGVELDVKYFFPGGYVLRFTTSIPIVSIHFWIYNSFPWSIV